MAPVPFNVKAETYLVRVVSLLICLEPLEGMLHLPLSPQSCKSSVLFGGQTRELNALDYLKPL